MLMIRSSQSIPSSGPHNLTRRFATFLFIGAAALGGCTMTSAKKAAGIDAVEQAATFAEHAASVCPGYAYNADAANADRAAQDVKSDARIDAAEKARTALQQDIDDGVYTPADKYCKTLDDPAVLADLRYLAKNI